jgi:glycerol-3-phosphate acyltransferase PlsY
MNFLLKTVPFIVSFCIGGIPTGYLLVKLVKKRDVRDFGSGNIGATNVYRTEGALLGSAVLVIDAGKAFAAAYLLAFLYSLPLFRLLLGITVILGNIFTPFLKFKGGKGVSAGLGVAIAMHPAATAISLGVFAVAVATTRYVSVGSISAVTAFLISTSLFFMYGNAPVYPLFFAILIFVTVIVRHISNIKRLFHGEENKIGSRKE